MFKAVGMHINIILWYSTLNLPDRLRFFPMGCGTPLHNEKFFKGCKTDTQVKQKDTEGGGNRVNNSFCLLPLSLCVFIPLSEFQTKGPTPELDSGKYSRIFSKFSLPSTPAFFLLDPFTYWFLLLVTKRILMSMNTHHW